MSVRPILSLGLLCSALMLGVLSNVVTGPAVPVGGVEDGYKQPGKDERKRFITMVDDLVNHNQPPRIVNTPGDRFPLFPAEYDWKEDERVRFALGKMRREKSPELWEELVRRIGDKRYCLTLKDNSESGALGNWSVGDFCATLAREWLFGVRDDHLPIDPRKPGYPIKLTRNENPYLDDWRKVRANKQLHELQIEVCEEAISGLAKVREVPQSEKEVAQKQLKQEIASLRKAQRAIFTDYSTTPIVFYSRAEAEQARDELRRRGLLRE